MNEEVLEIYMYTYMKNWYNFLCDFDALEIKIFNAKHYH